MTPHAWMNESFTSSIIAIEDLLRSLGPSEWIMIGSGLALVWLFFRSRG